VMFFTEYLVLTLQTEKHYFYILKAGADCTSPDTLSASCSMQACYGGHGA
jgi:hypothetical protein